MPHLREPARALPEPLLLQLGQAQKPLAPSCPSFPSSLPATLLWKGADLQKGVHTGTKYLEPLGAKGSRVFNHVPEHTHHRQLPHPQLPRSEQTNPQDSSQPQKHSLQYKTFNFCTGSGATRPTEAHRFLSRIKAESQVLGSLPQHHDAPCRARR